MFRIVPLDPGITNKQMIEYVFNNAPMGQEHMSEPTNIKLITFVYKYQELQVDVRVHTLQILKITIALKNVLMDILLIQNTKYCVKVC